MQRRSLRDLKPEERAILEEGKPKPIVPAAKEGPAAPAKVPTILVAYRWPEPLVKRLMEECHRRKMAGIKPHTQRELTAQVVQDFLDGLNK
jgi:hypothetical protein